VLARKAKGNRKVDDSKLMLWPKGVHRFASSTGSGAAADAALREMGMSRATYKEYVKRQGLKEHIIRAKDIRDDPITYGDLVARYDELKDRYYLEPGAVQFRLIDIQAAQMTLTDPNDDPVARAQSLAAALRRRLDAGEDFAALARQYSHDSRAWKAGCGTAGSTRWPPRTTCSHSADHAAGRGDRPRSLWPCFPHETGGEAEQRYRL
jgi:hypothetical protein